MSKGIKAIGKDGTNNSIVKVGDGVIRKNYADKNRGLSRLRYMLVSFIGGVPPIEYGGSYVRCDYERECLKLWDKSGFNAPKVIDLHSESDSELFMSIIEGPTLQDIILDNNITISNKLIHIKNVFHEMCKRHCWAIYEHKHRLIHYDSNTRNIIISNNDVFRVDFESAHLGEKIERSAIREVKKLTIEIINQIGREHSGLILDALIESYGIRHIVRRMVDEELGRSLKFLHDYRDRIKKKRINGFFSKLDLAYSLQQRGFASAKFLTDNDNDNDNDKGALEIVTHTSWDGKFYQSFDDKDPRGRDMQHRYGVMKFPQLLNGRHVLDIGCNIGRICIDAIEHGAERAVGIDYREDVIGAVNEYCDVNSINAEFYAVDINKGVKNLQKIIGEDSFDMVCALSIWSHVNKNKLWEIINEFSSNECIFEDNAPSRINSVDDIKQILKDNLDFSTIRFLGFTYDRGVRSVFYLCR